MEQKKHLRKALMWHKVKELNESGLNKSQIAQQVGIQRKTVRKYLLMDEDAFHSWIKKRRNMHKKRPGNDSPGLIINEKMYV